MKIVCWNGLPNINNIKKEPLTIVWALLSNFIWYPAIILDKDKLEVYEFKEFVKPPKNILEAEGITENDCLVYAFGIEDHW
jgi:hypothetical protein